jgi:MFS family permease
MERKGTLLPGESATSTFVLAGDKIQFWFFSAATLLTYVTILSTSFLSVILTSASMNQKATGIILSSPIVTTVLAIFFAGFLIQAFSALRTAIAGQLICLFSFLSFEWTIPDFAGTLASRALLGFGTGLFFAAALVYAKSKLQGLRTTYFFGIFSSMISFPAAIAPTLAEAYFYHYGAQYLFIALSVPVFSGLIISLFLKSDVTKRVDTIKRSDVTYLGLLRARTILIPLFMVTVVGLLWGFALSFMALLLHKNNVKTPYFFSVCTIALLSTRVFVLKLFTVARRAYTISTGLWFMAISYFALSLFQIAIATTVGAALLFGVGFSLAFPVISVWVSDQFEPHDRGKPVALFSASFQSGLFAAPLLVGMFSFYISLESMLVALAVLAVATSMLFLKPSLLRSKQLA